MWSLSFSSVPTPVPSQKPIMWQAGGPALREARARGRYDERMAVRQETALPIHRIDVETYNRIVASGALEGQRVELLEGLIVEMSPKSPEHVAVVTRLMRHFAAAPRWWLQVQDPIEVAPDSEPEPDLAVYEGPPPPGQHQRSALLVVEVAVNSHMIDRNAKARQYARADVPVYWLVDVPGKAVEVRTRPGPDGYEHCDTYREGTRIPSALADVRELDVAALFDGLDG